MADALGNSTGVPALGEADGVDAARRRASIAVDEMDAPYRRESSV